MAAWEIASIFESLNSTEKPEGISRCFENTLTKGSRKGDSQEFSSNAG